MADKLAGGIPPGTTSYSTDVVLRSASDGSPITGKVAADVTATYWRQGGTPTAITVSNLGSIGAGYSSGGWFEANLTTMPGSYRLDLPDAAIAAGSAAWVEINVFTLTSEVYKERWALGTDISVAVAAVQTTATAISSALTTAQTAITAIKAKTDQLVFTIANKVDAAINDATAMAQAAMDKAWVTASRSLNSIGNIINGVLDEAIAGHLTAGTVGKKINDAAAASDPLLNAVPGAYEAGTAGFVIGNQADNTTTINAINAKTTQLTFLGSLVQATGAGTAADIATAVWATVVEQQGSYTAKQALSIGLAVLAGVTANGGSTFKTPDGTVVRVQATLDAANERVVIILTPSA